MPILIWGLVRYIEKPAGSFRTGRWARQSWAEEGGLGEVGRAGEVAAAWAVVAWEGGRVSLPSSPSSFPFLSPLLSSLSTLPPLPYSLSLLLVQIVLSTFTLWPFQLTFLQLVGGK